MAEVTLILGTQAVEREVPGQSIEQDYAVAGLTCPSCISRVEKAVMALSGVRFARLNFTTGKLRVCLDRRSTDEGESTGTAQVIELLDSLGYRAALHRQDTASSMGEAMERELLRCLAVAGFAAANVMLLSVSVWSGFAGEMGPATRGLLHWVSALIALPALAYAGRPFFRAAFSGLRQGSLNMDLPISVAVFLATGLSLWRTWVGGELVYFDAALMLLFFLLIGRVLDRRLRNRARSSVENLLSLRGEVAQVVSPDGSVRSLAAEELLPNMRVRVAMGERLPADGRLLGETGSLDEAVITGESLPRQVGKGDQLYAGTLNLGEALELEVTARDEASLLARITHLLEEAERHRGRYRRLADRAAGFYAPIVHGLAVLTLVFWILWGQDWETALMNALAVLIITCPCALGLAVPAVQVVATGRLMRDGILVKAGDALERIAEVDQVVFDKTGTLTLGQPAVTRSSVMDDEQLRLAAGLASHSRHPLAKAIVIMARGQGLAPLEIASVREIAGRGLEGIDQGKLWRLGSADFCGLSAKDGPIEGTEAWLTAEGEPARFFAFADPLRPAVAETLSELQVMGLNLSLLSGDRKGIVGDLANRLGIADWQGECMPDEKIADLRLRQAAGHKILMVGDGLNDAPALAAADASLAPSLASDLAQTQADCVFQGQSLGSVTRLIKVARQARRLIMQNFGLTILYNLIAVPMAVAGLASPAIAALAMSASSLLVTLNALRLAGGKGPSS